MDKILEKLIMIQEALAQVTGQNPSPSGTSGTLPPPVTKPIGVILKDLIETLIGLGLIIATIIIVYAAYLMMFAGGNAEQFEKGKKAIFYTVIGVAVMLLSAVIVELIAELIGVNYRYPR